MKRSTFIKAGIAGATLFRADLLKAMVVTLDFVAAQEWKIASPAKKMIARRCIRYGEKQEPPRGHTLAALAWNESSLRIVVDHGEPSYGPFGISLRTAQYVRSELRKDISQGDLMDWSDTALIEMLENVFEYSADMALWLFNYHMEWFLSKGHPPTVAWKYAAQRYAGWSKWESRSKYGDIFEARAKFLKTLDIEDDELWT